MPIIRRSRKRDAMLTLMRSTTCHPSADWVYQRMREQYPDVSLGTVYRNLKQLAEEGLIKSVGVVDGQAARCWTFPTAYRRKPSSPLVRNMGLWCNPMRCISMAPVGSVHILKLSKQIFCGRKI